jgi:hypothetical protein
METFFRNFPSRDLSLPLRLLPFFMSESEATIYVTEDDEFQLALLASAVPSAVNGVEEIERERERDYDGEGARDRHEDRRLAERDREKLGLRDRDWERNRETVSR